MLKLIEGSIVMEIKNEGKYIYIKEKNVNLVFSSAEESLNFSRTYENFNENIEKIKDEFNLDKVVYLNQIHSDICYDYEDIKGTLIDGDALITNNKKIAVSVFTADCVPVLIYDEEKEVIAACHSGWKGTLNKIVINTVELMKNKYNCNSFKVVIGPHNMSCCYEVGNTIIDEFAKDPIYNGISIANNKNLNLLNCIKAQLGSIGIKDENISNIPYCTFCSKDIEFHSYRKDGLSSGRNLSFIFMEG